MNVLDFREMVNVNIKIFAFFGIILPKLDFRISVVMFFLRVFILTVFFCGGLALSQVIYMFLSFGRGGIRGIVSSSYLTLTEVMGITKSVWIFKNKRKISKLIMIMNRKEFQPKSCRQQEILTRYIRMSKTVTAIMIGIGICAWIFWGIYPFCVEGELFLPISSYFPYNTDGWPRFELTYAFQMIGLIVNATTGLNSDSFIIAMIMIVSAHLTTLDDSLRNIREHSEIELKEVYGYISTDILQKKMNKKLLECIRHHKLILKFKDDVSSLISGLLLGQFAVSALILCGTLFQMATAVTTIEFITLVMYQCCNLVEIFLLCYSGNEVIFKSRLLTTSAYHSNWQISSADFRKNVQIFLIRSQRDIVFMAGGFVPLSIEIFIRVLQSSMSYFTFLNQMSEKGN